jgi:hypothetical protein
LAEDLLLLLFQPGSGRRAGAGSIAGEGTLYYVLAGAVLAQLGLEGRVRTGTGRARSRVGAVAGDPPVDHLLRRTWDYVAGTPRGVQDVLAAMGPGLREPLLDRLVGRGDLRRSVRTRFAVLRTSALEEGDTGRRGGLIADVRAVLVEGAEPTARSAALAALLHASGTLPQFDREIPWIAPVIARAEELTAGVLGADAAAEAVARTVAATIVNSVAAAVVRARG